MTETTEDLFKDGLKQIYHAEKRLTDALEELEEGTDREEIAQAFADHREQTQEQINRLEQVFEALGESPETSTADGIEGLIDEHEEFVDTDPDQAVLDYYNMAAAEKTEHYEIAAYGNLIPLADQLGMDEEADILEKNLREEQETLEELKELTEQFDMDAMAPSQ